MHLAFSLALAALLALGLGYDHGFEWKRTDGLWWFLGGCALYYAVGAALAVALRDNRALAACPQGNLGLSLGVDRRTRASR